MKNITNNKNHNLNTQLCSVVRFYDEAGDYIEERYDDVWCDNLPEDIMEDLLSGEVICVEPLPDVEVFYFAKPKDWPENWAELGEHTRK